MEIHLHANRKGAALHQGIGDQPFVIEDRIVCDLRNLLSILDQLRIDHDRILPVCTDILDIVHPAVCLQFRRIKLMHQNLLININRFFRCSLKDLLALVEQDRTVTVFCDASKVVADKQDRLAFFFEILKFAVTFCLEKNVSDRQCLIHDQDLWIDIDGNGKCQPHKHTA